MFGHNKGIKHLFTGRSHIYVCAVTNLVPRCLSTLLVPSIDIYLSGLLARRQNAWSQDGGNMRVIANGVNR